MRRILYILLAASMTMVSCVNKDALNDRLEDLENRMAAIENAVAATNDNAIAVNRLLNDSTIILSFEKTKTGYVLELNTDTITVHNGIEAPEIVPIISIDSEGDWVYSIDNGENFNKVEASENIKVENNQAPIVRRGKDGYWEISTDSGKTWKNITDENGNKVPSSAGSSEVSVKAIFESISYDKAAEEFTFIIKPSGKTLHIPFISSFSFSLKDYNEGDKVTTNESKTYTVVSSGVKDVAIKTNEGWDAILEDDKLTVIAPDTPGTGTVTVIVVSDKGYVRTLTYKFMAIGLDQTACAEWNNFVMQNEENHLLDFSYAGYMRGETAPSDVYSLNYTIYNIKDYYGAGVGSDRDAFIAALTDALGSPTITTGNITFPDKPDARAIIYFPEGKYILHTCEDDRQSENKSVSITIRAGNFIIKGDGADKTKILMQDPMLPNNDNLYSSPVMLELKHNSSIENQLSANVSADSKKGSFSISVGSISGFNQDDWVCLHMKNSDPEVVKSELSPYNTDATWDISNNGIEVYEYHQIRRIDGNTIVFYEPIMYDIRSSWDWKVIRYPHYENVGVEDITFQGKATNNFVHHQDWYHDGGYKPLKMQRLVNSWIRRVRFESTSEACSITYSANVSAYDIEFTGNRGHAAIRSQASTRVLIAGTSDKTVDMSGLKGNFHGVGVSEHSIGTVLLRNTWGDDSCFESHCKQPRATLIDCCQGGWNGVSQGGDKSFAPHHLADLTIWNFEATKTPGGEFKWWNDDPWLKILPPIVVGFRSNDGMTFAADQTKVLSSHGIKVSPESLYETQLRHRLGYLPLWLNEIKY